MNNFTFTNLVSLPFKDIFITTFLFLILVLIIRYFRNLTHKLSRVESKLVEEVRSSVQTKFIETSVDTENLFSLAVEVWRMEQRLKKVIEKLNENQRKPLENSIEKIKRFVDKYDLEVRGYTGEKYNTGLSALEIVSVEKDPSISGDIVKETIEPAILLRGQVVKKAKVILLSKK